MRASLSGLVPLLLIALSGCSGEPNTPDGSPPPSPSNACDVVAGSTFLSVDEQECGLTPDGAASCRWSLSFTTESRQLTWQHSDVTETLPYECTCVCDPWSFTARTGASDALTHYGRYNTETGRLMWEGLEYEKVAH